MATITFKGNPLHTTGHPPAPGSPMPSFTLTQNDLGELHSAALAGKWAVLNIFPSVDTPVCAQSVRQFNREAAGLPNTAVLCVSADLPFAANRFCAAEGIKNVQMLSCFRHPEFGDILGIKIVDGPLLGLLARAVVVLGPDGRVRHSELVPEIAREPNYAAALAAIGGQERP